MASGRDIGIEDLLGQREWLRGLARHLAGQQGDGDDLAQEAWLAATRSPPEAGRPPRPWFAQVVRNLIRTRRRDDSRRAGRERQYQEVRADREAAVDEVYGRLELQRFLVEQVMALEEPLRTVIILHYFEGLDSARVAQLTGSPAGTVRWRMKKAIARLRQMLDQRHGGDRAAWVAVLVPTAIPMGRQTGSRSGKAHRGGAGLMASTKTKTLLISVAGLALLAISAAVLWRTVDEKARAPGARSTALERAGARPSTVAAALAAVPPPKLLLDPGLAPAERTLAGCFTALTQARQELVALEGEVRVLVPVEAFNEATPNSRLQAEVAPQIERLWPAAATSLGISYAVECRGWACGLNVVMPAEESPEVEPRLRAIGSWIPVIERLRDLRVTPPSALGIAVQWVGSRHSKDAVTGKKLDEWAFFFGAPPGTPGAGPASPVAVSPPPSADACPRELATTRARLRVRRAQLAGFRPSATLFADGQSAPELSGRMQAAVDRAGARARAECRSGICRLRFEQPPDPAALARLREDSDLGERLDKEQRNEADVYLTVREMGGPVLARLRAPVKGAGFFAGCPEPEREGNVLLRLLLPQTGMPNENGEFDHASVQAAGGSLARSPAAACLTERMAAVLSAQELPRPMAGLLRFESWSWRPGQPPRLVTPGAL